LHQEFGMGDISFDKADLIVIAGDLHVGIRGIEWLKSEYPEKEVIYVLGNHEYYGGSYPKTLNKIVDLSKDTNVHVLENESVEIAGIMFHGATLWTDFRLFGNPRTYGVLCQQLMNDYKVIRRDPSYSKLRTIDTYNLHMESMRWLDNSLKTSEAKTNIVVTHHAPSIKSVSKRHKKDSVTAAYASNLEEFILDHQPKYWIHGHIHTPVDYNIGNTKVICNPHGYINVGYNGHNRELILDL